MLAATGEMSAFGPFARTPLIKVLFLFTLTCATKSPSSPINTSCFLLSFFLPSLLPPYLNKLLPSQTTPFTDYSLHRLLPSQALLLPVMNTALSPSSRQWIDGVMVQTRARREETPPPQAQTPQDQQVPVDTDHSDRSVPSSQATSTANTDDATGETHATDSFDPHTDTTRAALDYRPKPHQGSKMYAIKALLQSVLDSFREPPTKPSSDLDELLSQWLGVWRENRRHSLLVYVLAPGSGQYQGRRPAVHNLDTIDQIMTGTLAQLCSKKGICLHLAKMTSAVNTSPDEVLDVKSTIQLLEIHHLRGGVLVDKPITIESESIIQRSLLRDRYHRCVAARKSNPFASPVSRTDTSINFQDWVSLSRVSFLSALDARISQHMQALVMLPKGHQFKFLAKIAEPSDLNGWIKTESANLSAPEDPATDASRRSAMTLACNLQLENLRRWVANGRKHGDSEAWVRQTKLLDEVIDASLDLRDSNIFGSAIIMDPMMIGVAQWKQIGRKMDLVNFRSSYRKW